MYRTYRTETTPIPQCLLHHTLACQKVNSLMAGTSEHSESYLRQQLQAKTYWVTLVSKHPHPKSELTLFMTVLSLQLWDPHQCLSNINLPLPTYWNHNNSNLPQGCHAVDTPKTMRCPEWWNSAANGSHPPIVLHAINHLWVKRRCSSIWTVTTSQSI